MADVTHYKKLNGDFCRRTGLISNPDKLALLGLHPRDAAGGFWTDDGKRLSAFCRKNPDYHIISIVNPGYKVNRFVAGCYRYYLAKGDDNPDLQLEYPPEVVNHLNSELLLCVRSAKPKL